VHILAIEVIKLVPNLIQTADSRQAMNNSGKQLIFRFALNTLISSIQYGQKAIYPLEGHLMATATSG
jgi:hypothetical protein